MKTKCIIQVRPSQIEFRMQHVPYTELQTILRHLRKRIPAMKWDGKVWRLPSPLFQELYEVLLTFFDSKQIQINFLNDDTNTASPRQLALEF